MPIEYLKSQPWSRWTRDERFFCAKLYEHASKDAAGFAKWIIKENSLKISPTGDWDLGFEVCFYRDFFFQQGETIHNNHLNIEFPPKRTFDLCLFGEKSIIIIEAKVCEPFARDQNGYFAKDINFIHQIPELENLAVVIVPLASSQYFENASKFGWKKTKDQKGTLDVFNGAKLTWAELATKYEEPLFDQADAMYKDRLERVYPKKPSK